MNYESSSFEPSRYSLFAITLPIGAKSKHVKVGRVNNNLTFIINLSEIKLTQTLLEQLMHAAGSFVVFI